MKTTFVFPDGSRDSEHDMPVIPQNTIITFNDEVYLVIGSTINIDTVTGNQEVRVDGPFPEER